MENNEALMWAKQLAGELCQLVTNKGIEETRKERCMMAALRTLIREVEDPNWRERIVELHGDDGKLAHPLESLSYLMAQMDERDKWLFMALLLKPCDEPSMRPSSAAFMYDYWLKGLQEAVSQLP